MSLKPEHKEYILQHAEDIREENWREFFKPGKYPEGIGEPLYQAHIPFMEALGYIPHYAFRDCGGLTSILIPNSVTSISNYAFYMCNNLTSILIPNSVTFIGDGAFSRCIGLKAVTFEENSKLTLIGDFGFNACRNLTSITIPDGVTEIRDRTFWNCSSLRSVTIPNSVTSLDTGAFYRCGSLTSVVMPNSVTSIGEDAFSDILTELTITYDGTKAQWEKIYNKDAFRNTYFTVKCTDG